MIGRAISSKSKNSIIKCSFAFKEDMKERNLITIQNILSKAYKGILYKVAKIMTMICRC